MKAKDFPLAVRKAFGGSKTDGTFIPCLKPCSGMKLLQFVDERSVNKLKVKNLPRARYIDVLVNHGNDADTLITLMDNRCINRKLQVIVDEAGEQAQPQLDQTRERSIMAGVFMAFAGASELGSIGLKAMTDQSCSLSTKGCVTKRSASTQRLDQILRRPDVTYDINPILGVVAAIYVVKGEFTFTAKTNNVARFGAQINAPPGVPVDIGVGLNCTWTNDGSIKVTADDPREWVIGIELHKVKLRIGQQKQGALGNAADWFCRLFHHELFGNAHPPDHNWYLTLAIIAIAIAIYLILRAH